MATGAATGRICLLGEHCDWAPEALSPRAALVAPLPRRVRVEARRGGWGLLVESGFGRSMATASLRLVEGDPNRYVVAAARALRDAGIPIPPARLRILSDLPAGRGFSSSAAVIVATIRALGALAGEELEVNRIVDLATSAERDQLGVPCGRMDPLACAYGTPLFIDWGPPERVEELEDPGLRLLAAAFPGGRSAEPILTALNAAVEAEDPQVCAAIRSWGEAAIRGAEALRRGDPEALGAEMNRAQARYEALDLPELEAPALRETCAALSERGALGAKFSGAGGDGSLVALFSEGEEARAAAGWLKARGLAVVSG